ncbi:MAG: bacteriophage CI repressor [Bacteroides sp.]|nr:bacteriophage CI repressor [Bacteroides sp.]
MTESEPSLISRLKDFISFTGLNNSQFADTCGIPRPSLSQILTGRNKKVSNQLIEQIHDAFPNLNIIWLLFGEGDMQVRDALSQDSFDSIGSEVGIDQNSLPDMPTENGLYLSDGSSNSIQAKENALTPPQNNPQTRMNKGIEGDLKIQELQLQIEKLKLQLANMTENPRKVASITVYYDDSTFETFVPTTKLKY